MSSQTRRAALFRIEEIDWADLAKVGAAHKYRYGHAGVVSGPSGQGGAARLAARGALRIGAGVVSVLCPEESAKEHASQLNAIMVKPFASQQGFGDLLKLLKTTAICIGPNLGLQENSVDCLGQVLKSGLPLCLDADAISLLSQPSKGLPGISNPQSLMTPHEGELRRYVPEAFERTSCRVVLAQTAADKAGCVVLFKGTDTIIAAPDARPVIVSSQRFKHASWLATAGSGDVLAGFATGLLARGFDAQRAASIAAELHLRCAEAFGPGLIAEDLPDALPAVFSLT